NNNQIKTPEIERLTTYETLQAYPSPMSVYSFDGQVTDGRLMFSVEVISSECNNAGEPIKINMFFQNLTTGPILITSGFNIINGGLGAGGNLTAIIFDSHKNRIYTLADRNLSSDTFYVPLNEYSTIFQNASKKFATDYYFPKKIYRNKTDEIRSTPTSGQYLIRFVYSDYQRENNNWEGVVSSNLITVCIK
ncbi:MAG TPA: hypothetical protein PLT08_18620, partial [Anaerolineales bacterium]|nr:hypothetical protein [Anaerolineales bacterium]